VAVTQNKLQCRVKTLLNYLYRAPLSWHGLHDVRSQPSPNAVVLRQLKCLIAVGLLIAVIIPLPAGAEGTPLPTGPNLSELETQDAVLASSNTGSSCTCGLVDHSAANFSRTPGVGYTPGQSYSLVYKCCGRNETHTVVTDNKGESKINGIRVGDYLRARGKRCGCK